jgi:NADPH-dependent 7-cyano-7-deazaguanine reductase QueF-like protein
MIESANNFACGTDIWQLFNLSYVI